MMNPQVKAEWVAALRSGEYKQSKGALQRKGEGYCCLGVLCDLYAKQHPEETTRTKWRPAGMGTVGFGPNVDTGLPPGYVYAWAEINAFTELNIRGVKAAIQNLNDGGGDSIPRDFAPATFEEIATAVEEQL